METTYNWNIQQMDRLTSDGFVVTVHYTVNAVDGDYTASTYGTVGYTQGEGSYVPYADLTEAEVVGWVQESLGKDTVEEGLAAQITAQKNPVQQSGLPWAE
jgi:myo-inositol-hexaphosphate 3-phosphohydrolase